MENQNLVGSYKMDLKDVFFRASSIGIIASGLIRYDLTENQKEEIKDLEAKKEAVTGLTEKQQKELEDLNSKETLTEKQSQKKANLEFKLTEKKGLTDKQQLRLNELIEKSKKKPELSQGAKTHIKEVWLRYEKHFDEQFSSKYTNKGTLAEEDSITLVSNVDNYMYIKNEKRIYKNNLTGECDIITEFEEDLKVIDDIKSSWNPKSFMNSELTTLYEWQGRAYMYLFNADLFRLRYCLVDCPESVYLEELKKFCFANNILDDSLPEYQDIISDFRKQFKYVETGLYSEQERVKTFVVQRDPALEEVIKTAIKLALEYYKTITLNMID